MTDNDRLSHLLRKSLDRTLPESVVDEVLTAAATTTGEGARFYRFLQRYNRDKDAGIAELLPDLSQGITAGNADRVRNAGTEPERKSVSFFRRAVREQAERIRSCDESHRAGEEIDPVGAAEAVATVLDERDHDAVPLKTLFCMALLLSIESASTEPEYRTD
jgi:hypothetical protein